MDLKACSEFICEPGVVWRQQAGLVCGHSESDHRDMTKECWWGSRKTKEKVTVSVLASDE